MVKIELATKELEFIIKACNNLYPHLGHDNKVLFDLTMDKLSVAHRDSHINDIVGDPVEPEIPLPEWLKSKGFVKESDDRINKCQMYYNEIGCWVVYWDENTFEFSSEYLSGIRGISRRQLELLLEALES